MARQIDLDDLDADDIAYLEARNWMIEEIKYQGHDWDALRAEALGESVDDGEDSSDVVLDNRGEPVVPTEPAAEDATGDEGDPDEDPDGEDDQDEPEDYKGEEWTIATLDEEIDRRNAEYAESDDDLIVDYKANKQSRIDALVKDDAEIAAAESDEDAE